MKTGQNKEKSVQGKKFKGKRNEKRREEIKYEQ